MTAPQDQAAGDHTIPVALPAQLHDAGLEDWFAERVRPLVGGEAEDFVDGTWGGPGDGLSSGELDAVVSRMRRCDGAPERATLTLMAGWNAGYVAWVIASAMLRDGVLVRASRPGVLRALRHPDGWCTDARLGADAEVAAAAGHPWCGRPGVETLPDRASWKPRRLRRSSGRARRSSRCSPRGRAVAARVCGRRSPTASAARLTRCMTPSLRSRRIRSSARPSGSSTPRARVEAAT